MKGAGVALNHNLWAFALVKTGAVAAVCATAWATAKK
jgi:hypothetical protein